MTNWILKRYSENTTVHGKIHTLLTWRRDVFLKHAFTKYILSAHLCQTLFRYRRCRLGQLRCDSALTGLMI
jgi:hypothetical protein